MIYINHGIYIYKTCLLLTVTKTFLTKNEKGKSSLAYLRYRVFIVNFKQISHIVLVLPMLA